MREIESLARSLVSRHRHASTRFHALLRRCTDAGVDCPKDAPERIEWQDASETLVIHIARSLMLKAAEEEYQAKGRRRAAAMVTSDEETLPWAAASPAPSAADMALRAASRVDTDPDAGRGPSEYADEGPDWDGGTP